MRKQLKLGWTTDAVVTANANYINPGLGTMYKIFTVQDPAGGYVDTVQAVKLGTNTSATQAAIFAVYGDGTNEPDNVDLIRVRELAATIDGTYAVADETEFPIGAWFDQAFSLYCTIHTAGVTTDGWKFTAYADPSYQSL